MQQSRKLAAILIVLLSAGPGTAAPAAPQLDLGELAKIGAQTEEKLATKPASWTAEHTLGSGNVMKYSVVREGGKRRTTITRHPVGGVGAAKPTVIISRDGFWYVSSAAGSFKYRPYELPTDSPFDYICLDRSNPNFHTADSPLLAGTLQSMTGNIAVFRQPIPPDQSTMVRTAISAMEARGQESMTPENAALVKQLKDLLANGLSTQVNATTGQLLEYGTIKLRTRVTDVKFLPAIDESIFDVKGKEWEDFSDDPTAGDLNDLTMVINDPRIRPGDKKQDPDGRLLNVKTGQFRRIPFHGGAVMPGCFLKDRRFIVVCGLDNDSAVLRPYRIDLKTGENQPLGGEALNSGVTLGADLSPDGKTLVALHHPPSAEILNQQVVVFDTEGGEAKSIGKLQDTAFLNWTADGRHIVLLHRKSVDMNKPAITSLAIMDMQGTVKLLRKGDAPVLLNDRSTILYEVPETRLWHTCDLAGEHDAVFGDGLKGYGFPSPSPDGKRILMMHFTPGTLPSMVVLKVGESSGTQIEAGPGLWGIPAWR